jgi:hypothetical protein
MKQENGTNGHFMVPKLDQHRGYASKPRILLCCSVAMQHGKKSVTGQFMVQARGKELKQITAIAAQTARGIPDAGERGAVTAGKNLDGFVELVKCKCADSMR